MKRTLIITCLVLLLIASPAAAYDDWDRTDYALLAASTALQVIDWRQTLRIADNPGRYYEGNPLLPRHPDRGQVDRYFVGSFLIRAGVAYVLPSRWRKVWLGAMTAGSLGMVIHNDSIGLGISW